VTALDPRFVASLREAIQGEVRQDEPLARYSTFRIGGPGTVVLPDTPEDVAITLRHAHDAGVPWLALGLGSNVLLPDSGLEALVIRLGKGTDSVRSDGDRWWFGAGLPAPLAARQTAAAGYGGLHKMVGVPGTVGGGVFMNAGCHGAEWSDVVKRVTVVDPNGCDRVLDREEIAFSYRRSGLGKVIVLGTEVVLDPADPELLQQEVQDLFEWRQRGTPDSFSMQPASRATRSARFRFLPSTPTISSISVEARLRMFAGSSNTHGIVFRTNSMSGSNSR